jgi:hypothetical protein
MASDVARYKLTRAFFDGAVYRAKGEVIELVRGTAPSSAVCLDPLPEPPAAEEAPVVNKDPDDSQPSLPLSKEADTMTDLTKEIAPAPNEGAKTMSELLKKGK